MKEYNLKLFENSIPFQYLKEYYKMDDFATRYGVDRYEIRHSNFLAWIFNPNNSHGLKDMAIRELLESLINYYPYSKGLKDTLLTKTYVIKEAEVMREQDNIDILIDMLVNEQRVKVIIENKVYSKLDDKQLGTYKSKIESNSKDNDENVYLYLHPNFNKEIEKARLDGFYSITYQDLYNNVLNQIRPLATTYETKIAIEDYIHCLSKPTHDDGGLIITIEEKDMIGQLINQYKFILLSLLKNRCEDEEFNKFYHDNEVLFNIIFNKCVNDFGKETIKIDCEFQKLITKSRKSNVFIDENGNKQEFSNCDLLYNLLKDIIEKHNIKTREEFPTKILNSTNQPALLLDTMSIKFDEGRIDSIYRENKKGQKPIKIGNEPVQYLCNVMADEIEHLMQATIEVYPEYQGRLYRI